VPLPARSRANTPDRGVRAFPKAAELAAEAAGAQAEHGQQAGLLAVLGVYLVQELLASLRSLVVVALAPSSLMISSLLMFTSPKLRSVWVRVFVLSWPFSVKVAR
jgi:hypothetical protein